MRIYLLLLFFCTCQTQIPRGTERFVPKSNELRALVVGIDTYPEAPLQCAVADAQALISRLRSLGYRVVPLLNGEATREGIQAGLRKLAGGSPEDRVVIYFAGHGVRDEGGKGYLCPIDYRALDLGGSALPMDDIGTWRSEIAASEVLVLLDCCYAGLSMEERQETKGNTYLISAGRGDEAAWELPNGHGLFTYFLLTGMAGAADTSPADETVDAYELGNYVSRKLAHWSKGKQNPRHGALGVRATYRFPLQPEDAGRLREHLDYLGSIQSYLEDPNPTPQQTKKTVTLEAEGVGFPKQGETNPTKRIMMARQAAKLQAMRELLEQVAVEIRAQAKSKDMTYSKSEVESRAHGLIKGAQIIEEGVGPDDSYRIKLRLFMVYIGI